MWRMVLVLTVCVSWAGGARVEAAGVRFGVDVLRDDAFGPIRGQRVGLVAHAASVDDRLVPTAELLNGPAAREAGVNLVALFAPEHGLWGAVPAGEPVAEAVDGRSGLTVHSLYGRTRKPTPQMLEGIDVLVFDLQDIGVRSYTYVSTLALCLEACAEQGVRLIVLDRPNPLGGTRIEGPTLRPAFESFVGKIPTPYVHGMTVGEIARMLRERDHPTYEGLTVVPMAGWDREMTWTATGRLWIAPSPHVPTFDAAVACVATGLIGELGTLSNGVGWTLPFGVVGSPKAGDEREVVARLAASYDGPWPAGLFVSALRFKPFYATFVGEVCHGVRLWIDPNTSANLVELNVRLLETLDVRRALDTAAADRKAMFDKTWGTDDVRRHLEAGRPSAELFGRWRVENRTFRDERRGWLLYPDRQPIAR